MKAKYVVLLIALTTPVTTIAKAQSSREGPTSAKETQTLGYWIDTSGLMWAGKDNGKDVNWKKAMKYCRDLRLAGYSDWRLATLYELRDIYDSDLEAPGLAGPPQKQRAFAWHVNGNLFLTGNQWSSSQIPDDRGKPSGYASRFDFNEGKSFDGDEVTFYTNKRALCVRRVKE